MERSDVSVIKKSKKALNRQTTIYKIPAQLLMLLCLCETYLDCQNLFSTQPTFFFESVLQLLFCHTSLIY